jgi:hypothetical protein
MCVPYTTPTVVCQLASNFFKDHITKEHLRIATTLERNALRFNIFVAKVNNEGSRSHFLRSPESLYLLETWIRRTLETCVDVIHGVCNHICSAFVHIVRKRENSHLRWAGGGL